MGSKDCKLDVNAGEFVPSCVLEKAKAVEMINAFVNQAFDRCAQVSESAISKLEKVLHLESIPTTPSYVGEALVEHSLNRSGNAAWAFRIILRLQASSSQSVNSLLEYGIFEKIHEITKRLISGNFLLETAGIKPVDTSESGDFATVDNRPALLVELLHLIVMCIMDLYKSDGQMSLSPLTPCVDLCMLSDAVLRVQMDAVKAEDSKSEPSSASTSTTFRSPRRNEWNHILDAFLTKLSQTLPYFNLLLQYSDPCVPPTMWVSTPSLNPPPSRNDESLQMTNCITSQHLATLIDSVLFRVKHMMVLDGGFPSKWIRSTAMELLLTGASSYNPVFVCGENSNEWRGGSDDEDDIVIEGVTDTQDSEILKDFRDFLTSTGQR